MKRRAHEWNAEERRKDKRKRAMNEFIKKKRHMTRAELCTRMHGEDKRHEEKRQEAKKKT